MDNEFVERFPARFALLENTENWVRWRIPCSCHDARDDFLFDVEFDKEINALVMRIYGTTTTKRYNSKENIFLNFLSDMYMRVKVALHVLLLGYHEYEGEIMIMTQEDIINLGNLIAEVGQKMQPGQGN